MTNVLLGTFIGYVNRGALWSSLAGWTDHLLEFIGYLGSPFHSLSYCLFVLFLGGRGVTVGELTAGGRKRDMVLFAKAVK